ncbi:hypothetical protein LTR91_002660 [Friedmanniomyces endolithicus]|uniref:Uncharacterized protein n=1 Tax=Friedmanniomyces endolithicus TaxID=329885 RepID=A0AAN6R0D1_9PEZI|nr:hypothetical protein LTR35_004547 [Friedmanniomyces endolithicus]KAK0299014.1 hypothetical protein LTS00_002124 [Friedmanniomyces endolithicus]KAK0322886.1 hypothetical protein LTR82_006343 [Friedmanniomyces endolithicus]KAK0906618.1 hypothetical protein LTR57_017709 [Friedmanniomyces endolithicus]KAK0967216.1 hypothetical protein LTS01_017380 [Friedmanniomyces endolithicus]
MTGLKHFLKKKEKIDEATPPAVLVERSGNLDVPEFKCIRTTTETEEVIQPPSYPGDDDQDGNMMGSPRKEKKRPHLGFRRSTNNSSHTRNASGDSLASQVTEKGEQQLPVRPKTERKLSERFHLHRDRSRSVSTGSSSHLPDDLPEAPAPTPAPAREGEKVVREEKDVKEHREAQWEKRATILAHSNPSLLEDHQEQRQEKRRSHSPSITDHAGDETIQEAIRLHELGDLTRSTAMFGRLASPTGANNALAQVLYGLALRHGWGIPPEPENAIHYLALAASNSASVEEAALASGTKKGGAAKGELVLAVFELANCFRHGWGVKKDPVAARQYYETAANLQDTDAMEEAAWCWLEGFGGRKDKVGNPSALPAIMTQDPSNPSDHRARERASTPHSRDTHLQTPYKLGTKTHGEA